VSALPRGMCPVCGADAAVRRNGETRQHDRWETFATATGLDGRRRATCPGTGQPSKTVSAVQDRWCESCESWSSTSDTTCPVHQTPTETAEQIRRDRDALRADCARISEFDRNLRETFHDRTNTDLPPAARLNDALELLGADECAACKVAYPGMCRLHASIIWRAR